MEILIVHDRDRDVRSEIALEKTRLEIGSDLGSDVVVSAQGVAPRHCAIERAGGGWKVVDRGSDHGTLVNGGFVSQKLLRPGDRVEIGSVTLELGKRARVARTPAASPTVAKPARPRETENRVNAAVPASRTDARSTSSTTPRGTAECPDDIVFLFNTAPLQPEEERYPLETISGVHRAARRRGATRYGGAVVAIAALAIAVTFAIRASDRARRPAFGDPVVERLEVAKTWRESGEFERARVELRELLATELLPPAASRAQSELQQVDEDEDRLAHARDLIAEIEAAGNADPAMLLEWTNEALLEYGEVPQAVRLRAMQREFSRRVAAATRDRDPAGRLRERMRLTDELVEKGEFGAARTLWEELAVSDLQCDRFAARNGIASLEAGAATIVAAIVGPATQALDAGDLVAAQAVLEPDLVAGLRGTARSAEVDALAERLAVRIGETSPQPGLVAFRHAPKDRDDLSGRSGKPATAPAPGPNSPPTPSPTPSGPLAPPSAPTPAPPPPDGTAAPARPKEVPLPPVAPFAPDRSIGGTDGELAALRDGDALFARGDFDGAREVFEKALPAASKASKPRLERRVERSRRASAFLSLLLGKIGESPAAVASVEVKTRDGGSGRVKAVSHGSLTLDSASGAREVSVAELAPASCLALSHKLKWTPAESLDQAAFALSAGDAKEIDAALTRAAGDTAQKNEVDRLVALWRGIEDIPEWGFFKQDGEWITFAEREQRQYDKLVKKAVAKLDQDDRSHAKGIEELNELLPVAKDRIAVQLRERRKKLLAAVAATPEWKALDRLYAERNRLEEARKPALELIFDEVRYFYPYSPPAVPPDMKQVYDKVQKEVEERVEKVREIWGKEHEDSTGGIALSAIFTRLVSLLATERGMLAVADPQDPGDGPEMARLDLLPVGVDRMSVRDVALDLTERARLDQDRQVLAYNATMTSSATEVEIDQVRITNEYRRMMGRRALAIHEKLMRSSRGHSEWMSRTGIMTHFNEQDPSLRTPGDRIRAQGYVSGGSGENVARNPGGASGAHEGWIHSSGHHRNILWEGHTEMGTGNMGNYWTQNFAGGTDYLGNLVADDE